MSYVLGAGTEPLAAATAIAMQRNASNVNDSLTRAAQMAMRRKELQAQQDAQIRQLGFQTAEMNQRAAEADADRQQQANLLGSRQKFEGQQADANRAMQGYQFGATNDRMNRVQAAAQAHQDREDEISRLLANGTLSMQDAQQEKMRNDAEHQRNMDAVVSGNARDAHDAHALRMEREKYQFDVDKKNPVNLVNRIMYDSLIGGGAQQPPATQQTPGTPPVVDNRFGPGSQFDISMGTPGDVGATTPSFGPDYTAPSFTTQSPQNGIAGLLGGGNGFAQSYLRKQLGIPDQDTMNFNKQVQALQLRKMQAEADAAEGILSPTQTRQQDASDVEQATKAAQAYMMDQHLAPNDAVTRALGPMNARRRALKLRELTADDLGAQQPTYDNTPLGLARVVGQDPSAMYGTALDNVVKADPELQNGIGSLLGTQYEKANESRPSHYLGTTLAGLLGDKTPAQDPYYQKTHAKNIVSEIIKVAAQSGRQLAPEQAQQIYLQNRKN